MKILLASLAFTLTNRVLTLAHPVDGDNDIVIEDVRIIFPDDGNQKQQQVGWQACKCMQSQQILTHFCPHTERSHWDTQCQTVT